MFECFLLGIAFEAYSPLGNPSNPFLSGDEPRLLDNEVVKEIADKHSVTVAQVSSTYGLVALYMSNVCFAGVVSVPASSRCCSVGKVSERVSY